MVLKNNWSNGFPKGIIMISQMRYYLDDMVDERSVGVERLL